MNDKYKTAACGVDCNACAQYKVTINHDLEAAELLVEWFKSQGWIGENEGAEAVMKKSPLCKGCWNITDDCFWKCGCGEIDFRICCNEKQINHCGECNDFPCSHYKEWASWHESHQKAMDYLLRKKYVKNNYP
ncbi:MAG: DUF3795 domain-containing protein [Defluviitaleaceae bacterium]|nr:DUF3795 domain-containing protein [Defluviitaleaceae bacterium]